MKRKSKAFWIGFLVVAAAVVALVIFVIVEVFKMADSLG